MKITYKNGDLFETELTCIAHGCNTEGKMGAGIAKTLKKMYPQMYKKYKIRCGEGSFTPERGLIYRTEDANIIFNLATQSSLLGAQPNMIKSALRWMKNKLIELNINAIAMPKIGCGLGRLNWEKDVYPIIYDTFYDHDIHIEVWEFN